MLGLDIGQCINGFVYHTKYDRIDVIPRAALQNTGDNLLGLVQTLSNASELRDLSVGASVLCKITLVKLCNVSEIRRIRPATPSFSMSWDCI